MTVRFACGHVGEVAVEKQRPICVVCGSTRVQRVTARAPRFHGTVSGPSAKTEAIPAMPVSLRSEGV